MPSMDTVFSLILIALVAYHVILGLALTAWMGWEAIVQPVRRLWLRLHPVSAVPVIDLRDARTRI